MNKATLQGMAAGIIFTTAIFGGFYYGTRLNEDTTPTIDEAKSLLENKGFTVSLVDNTLKPDNPSHKDESEDRTTNKEMNEKDNNQKEDTVVTYTLIVKANMTTSEIAKTLAKEKIIEDATSFESYVKKQGFSKKIQIGEFIVTANMTYRQLLKTLTY